jgi:hypothetical protein
VRPEEVAGLSNNADDDDTATIMAELAEAFRIGTAEEAGIELGWEASDVTKLDELAEMFVSSDPPADVRQSMVMAMGAYLGELLVRHTDGHWEYDPEHRAAIITLPNGVTDDPQSRIAKRLDGGGTDDLAAFYEQAVRGPDAS